MEELFINILRGGTTAVMNVLLLFTLAQPRFGRRVTVGTAVVVCLLDLATSMVFYRTGNLTALAQFDVFFLLLVGVALKPLMRDSIMQWCFNFLTAMNLYAIVTVLSFHLCDFFPNPYYANIGLRFVLYGLVILLFRRFLKPMYRRVAENWQVFLTLAVCVFANFAYYFVFTEDVEQTLTDAMWPMLLLIGLTMAVYGSVFLFLKKTLREYALREENLTMKNNAQLLHLAADNMAQRLNLMDEATQQNNLAAHNRRHFNNMLLELLESGEEQSAIDLLQTQIADVPKTSRIYCENPAVNAAVSHYVALAEQQHIQTKIELNIPTNLPVDALEFSMVVSNLLENAVQACQRLPAGREKRIDFVCQSVGRLLLEMETPAQTIPCLMKTAALSHRRKDMASGARVSLPLQKNMTEKSFTAFKTKFSECVCFSENGRFSFINSQFKLNMLF